MQKPYTASAVAVFPLAIGLVEQLPAQADRRNEALGILLRSVCAPPASRQVPTARPRDR